MDPTNGIIFQGLQGLVVKFYPKADLTCFQADSPYNFVYLKRIRVRKLKLQICQCEERLSFHGDGYL